jgi:hypothetical protein
LELGRDGGRSFQGRVGDVEKKESRERRGNFKTRLRTEDPNDATTFQVTTQQVRWIEEVYLFRFSDLDSLGGWYLNNEVLHNVGVAISLNSYLFKFVNRQWVLHNWSPYSRCEYGVSTVNL